MCSQYTAPRSRWLSSAASCPLPARLALPLLAACLLLFAPAPVRAQEPAVADVVVIVDTSTSMVEEGMDPQWASLLVTKLFTDIVPGDLAVVRLLDLKADQDLLLRRETGVTEPCAEDPTKQCEVVEPASDWQQDARDKKLGALVRPARGDAAFKQELESHLERRINNSLFFLAFRSAQGVFDEHRADAGRPAGIPQTVLWLSDGRAREPDGVRQAIRDLMAEKVAVEAIVFGRGDTSLARSAGLEVRQVSNPAEIMKAFAGAFRRVVQAPYEIDNLVASRPRFEMEKNVDEAWVVVYGDASLGEVELDGPAGVVRTDHAADRWTSAGAYRVAYLKRPPTGTWTVRAAGGGGGVAYAVVQRSALTPALLEPSSATSGLEVPLVAGVRAGLEGELLADTELLRDLELTAELQGQTVTLRDDGNAGDAVAGDGRYTALVTFRGSGRVPVTLRLSGPVVDRSVVAEVEITGEFRFTGGPIAVDLGTLGVASEACRPLVFTPDVHRGEVSFELERLRRLPSGHQLEVRLPAGTLTPGGDPVLAGPEDRFEVCLLTADDVPSSSADGEPWLELRVAGSSAAEQSLTLELSWQVEGLSFWQRWGWLILTILGLLLLAFIVAGFIVPHRFKGSLALVFVPDRDELDEVTAQPVKQWKGVRIGFYRHARAYLHADFRLSGNAQGALAGLQAESRGVKVLPGKGAPLSRETLDGDWETVAPQGRKGRAGDVYRIGDQGPYFRIATHRGR